MKKPIEEKKLKLGLVLAGAISAGAYSAGVLDYFLQVLDKWEEMRKEYSGAPGVPSHRVQIEILSGASAGGMAASMATVAIQKPRHPITPAYRGDQEYLKKNIFYHAWVDMLGPEMLEHLLDTSDIKANNQVVSALNSTFVQQIAEREIHPEGCDETYIPAYIHPKMQLICSLSNLEGFNYRLKFSGETGFQHHMTEYRDYAFFRLGQQYEEDGRIPLNIAQLTGIAELQQAAMATGAFPIGLAYRAFHRKTKYITDNPYLKKNDEKHAHRTKVQLVLDFKDADPESIITTYHVDGGMLNNEPFDIVMQELGKSREADLDSQSFLLDTHEKSFGSSIILIDPFPSEEKQGSQDTRPTPERPANSLFPFNLIEIITKLYTVMRGQLLFKGKEIVAAFDEEDFSRFLIAPSRKPVGKEKIKGNKAIACGSLDGFGGFFDVEFRRHDFFLGRANCQSFLRNHFRVQLNHKGGEPINPILKSGYDQKSILRFQYQDEEEKAEYGEKANWYVPIIPDLTMYQQQDDGTHSCSKDNHLEPPYPFPKYDLTRFESYKKKIQKRAKLVLLDMLPASFKIGGGLLYQLFVRKKVFRTLRDMVQKDLLDRDLLK